MKKLLSLIFILLLSISLIGCTVSGSEKPAGEEITQTDEEQAVSAVVGEFGKKLQTVSLLAPDDILKESIQESYGELVTSGLLENWLQEPQNAPGRTVSSPWPDRIEIESIEKISDDTYEVNGKVIEITSTEQENGGAAAKYPITLTVKSLDDSWLIDEIITGDYIDSETVTEDETAAVAYENTEYGFRFSLPQSWEGYSVITDDWEGFTPDKPDKAAETGPVIYIRHPQWTKETQRQDIPVMIFTIAQWDSMNKDGFHIGAAPTNPSEISRNSEYVFALPARYNFAFPAGYEEVEEILNGSPIQVIK